MEYTQINNDNDNDNDNDIYLNYELQELFDKIWNKTNYSLNELILNTDLNLSKNNSNKDEV